MTVEQADPAEAGQFDRFGGRYVPEALVGALDELERQAAEALADPAFVARLERLRGDYAGRPTPLTAAPRLSREAGCSVWLKREDLAHTGSHKINNVLGQGLLAERMGKPRVVAETGAGQHGVATATAAAMLGLECVVYMGAEDCRRQRLNVVRMELLGATVVPVETGTRTLKDAINEAMRDWVANVESTHYLIGSVVGPHPFPTLVRDLQRVIGDEARAQCLDRLGRLPDVVVACVGGGSNAAGTFVPFVDDAQVRLVGAEAGGAGGTAGAAPLAHGTEGILHGARSKVLQDEWGQVLPTGSVSAGLDYPGVGPEHAHLQELGRVEYVAVTDDEALRAFRTLAATEGILPALEPSHALGWVLREGAALGGDAEVVVTLSGRGDKDVDEVARVLGLDGGADGGDAKAPR